MLQRLLTCEAEVAAVERRLEARRTAVARQARRTGEAMKARLARPDALVASAGLGALYGLWVSRPRAGSAGREQQRSHRKLRVPGWLVRAAVSMVATRLFAESVGEASDSAQGTGDDPGIEP